MLARFWKLIKKAAKAVVEFVKDVAKKATETVVSVVREIVTNLPAITFLTLASLSMTSIFSVIIKKIALPAIIDKAMIAPILSVLVVTGIVTFMNRIDSNNLMAKGLFRGLKSFQVLSPGIPSAFKTVWVRNAFQARRMFILLTMFVSKKISASDLIGMQIGRSVLKIGLSRVRRGVSDLHMIAQINSERTLPNDPVIRKLETRNKRMVRRMRVVYHDANKAGKHLDVHVGRTSLVYRIKGKPKIAFRNGILTEDARKELLNYLKGEIARNSRVAQNLDHSSEEAQCFWKVGENGINGYGSGTTRQLVAEGDVEIGRRIYAPLIDSHHGLYIHQLYQGEKNKAPICIFGTIDTKDMDFEDRLHLKLTRDLEVFKGKVDPSTAARKYDGASAYFVSDGKTVRLFSPRVSSVTGKRIEYTWKAPEIEKTAIPGRPVGIGEFLIWKRNWLGKLLNEFGIRGPEGIAWNYLTSNQIGGVLNANQVRPRDLLPELRLYRVDSWVTSDNRRQPVSDLSFDENRAIQKSISRHNPLFIKVVDLHPPEQVEGWEGIVGVPHGHSINKGVKLIFTGGINDWLVVKNNMHVNDRGNVEGAILFRSLDSGKEFNLGPGQIGDRKFTNTLISLGDRLNGAVAKVESKRGHEGRSSRFAGWHLDKGVAV